MNATTAPSGRLLTSDLFREVHTTANAHDLVAVGIALHHFTELVRELVPVDPIELHRATTILTRQVTELLDADAPLDTICALMTDPDRVATADGRTSAELCGDAWPEVQESSNERTVSALEGAETFGAATVLHLAATRAVRPRHVWWGTDGWNKRVDEWLSAHPESEHLRPMLTNEPEHAEADVLVDLIDD